MKEGIFSVSLPSTEEIEKVSRARFKGRNHIKWKSEIFKAGVNWMKSVVIGCSDIVDIEELLKEIDSLNSEIGYMGIDSIKDAHSAQQALDILKSRIEQKLPIQNVSDTACRHPKPWKNTPWGYKVCPECNDIVEWEQTAP